MELGNPTTYGPVLTKQESSALRGTATLIVLGMAVVLAEIDGTYANGEAMGLLDVITGQRGPLLGLAFCSGIVQGRIIDVFGT